MWRAAGDAWGTAFAGRLRGLALARAGDFDGADAVLRQARRELTAIGAAPDVVETDVAIAELLLLRGRREEAIELLDAIIAADPTRAGLEHVLAPVLRLRGTARAAISEHDGADDIARALAIARERGADQDVALCLRAERLVRSWRGEHLDEASAAELNDIEQRLGLGPRLEPSRSPLVSGT